MQVYVCDGDDAEIVYCQFVRRGFLVLVSLSCLISRCNRKLDDGLRV